MSSEAVVLCEDLGKCYHIYQRPHHRLLQMMWQGKKTYYREFWALRNATFMVAKGETVGIVGRNGSGKSTLLQLICGTLNPSFGRVETSGRVAALLELGSGFNLEFTGRENVYLNGQIMGLNRQQVDERLDDVLAFADIGEFIDQPVKTYSSGMMVRLAFSVIAHVDAELLIIDEALAVGDAVFNRRCMRFIRQFKQDHSLIFVSHDMSSVINLCDRTIWVDRGEIRKIGGTKQVCDAYLNTILFAEESEPSTDCLSLGVNDLRSHRISQDNSRISDQRQEFINYSNLRNDIEVFEFGSVGANDVGGDEAHVNSVSLLGSERVPLKWIVGGERVVLSIEIEAAKYIEHVIVGFYLRDKLGQNVFGDNTYLSFLDNIASLNAGGSLKAEFEFVMPWLVRGDYSIVAAVAERYGQADRLLHWKHEALSLQSHVAPIPTGLVGIPMLDIRLIQLV